MNLEEKLRKIEQQLYNLRLDIENDRIKMLSDLKEEFYSDIEDTAISSMIDKVRGK